MRRPRSVRSGSGTTRRRRLQRRPRRPHRLCAGATRERGEEAGLKEVLRTRRCHKKECVTSAPFQPEHRNVIERAGSFLFLPPVTPLPGSVSPTRQTGSPGKGDLCAVGPRCPSADECHPLLQEGAVVPTIPPAMKRSTLGLRSQDLRPKDSKTLFADEQKCSQDRRSPHQRWPLPQPRRSVLRVLLALSGGRKGGRGRETEGERGRE